jgi:Na+-transporting methylmalonyl-CoA/oxaloacetate decarboxylase gamma subunit
MAAGVVLLLGLLVYFLRTLSRVRARSMEGWRPVLMPVSELALQQGAPYYGMPAFPADAPQAALPQYQPPAVARDDDLMPEIAARSSGSSFPEDEQKARIIQKLTEENPTAVAEIIQIWLSEDERRNA